LKDYIKKQDNFYIVKEPDKFKEMFEKKHYDENYIIVTVGAGDIWKHGLSVKVD
jgi:UDP-N-acetylmuramate-alanine ligase